MTVKKCVRWSTVTVYEFGVGIGGSAIPKRGGPAIGLARKPKHVWSSSLDDLCLTHNDNDNDNTDSYDQHDTTSSSSGTQDVARKPQRLPRRRKVRWLKPLERVTMLTNAGCSEKKIFRMLQECSDIAMSRRLSLCVDRRSRSSTGVSA